MKVSDGKLTVSNATGAINNKLNFIDIKAGRSGPMSHVLLYNPHFVVRDHYAKKTPGLTEASYTALLEWALDIGARDMVDPLPDGTV